MSTPQNNTDTERVFFTVCVHVFVCVCVQSPQNSESQMEMGPQLNVSSDRMEKLGMKHVTHGL